MSRLMLLSNSTMPGTGFFTWPKNHVKKFLGPAVKAVTFIPYAAVTISFDAYADFVSKAFNDMGYEVRFVHQVADKKGLINDAEAIVVGGGNTFALLSRIYAEDLLEVVQSRVAAGAPYVGWSAGANVACPTLKTTNDMPVVMPPAFDAFNLVPFQLNPHYHELKFQNQGGETRKDRLEEFLVLNPDRRVVGLPEGMLIERDGDVLTVQGEGTAKLFEVGKVVRELRGGTDVSFLLDA